jgi:hypothetical protein
MPGKNKKKGSKKRKQTTCGGGSSPRRGSRSRSVSPKRSRSKSASPKRSRSANSNNMNNIERSPDYDAPYNYDAIHNILWTFKDNDPKKVTRALRHYINKENLDKFVVSLKNKPHSKIKEIYGWLDLNHIENRINTDEELYKKEKKEKIKLFRELKPKILNLEFNAFYRKGPPQLVEATSITESLAALRDPRRRW